MLNVLKGEHLVMNIQEQRKKKTYLNKASSKIKNFASKTTNSKTDFTNEKQSEITLKQQSSKKSNFRNLKINQKSEKNFNILLKFLQEEKQNDFNNSQKLLNKIIYFSQETRKDINSKSQKLNQISKIIDIEVEKSEENSTDAFYIALYELNKSINELQENAKDGAEWNYHLSRADNSSSNQECIVQGTDNLISCEQNINSVLQELTKKINNVLQKPIKNKVFQNNNSKQQINKKLNLTQTKHDKNLNLKNLKFKVKPKEKANFLTYNIQQNSILINKFYKKSKKKEIKLC